MAGFFKKLFGGSNEETAQAQPTPTPVVASHQPVPVAGVQAGDRSTLTAHMEGTVIELDQVSDQTFASGALGAGVAIEPATGRVVAPANGTITLAFPTGHAFGMLTEDGLEILIHVGFDTVELDGKHFNPRVAKGDTVKRGDVLVEFDLEKVRAAEYPVTTPMVITNAKSATSSLEVASAGELVQAGDPLLDIVRKVN